jgi:hypothetical protein
LWDRLWNSSACGYAYSKKDQANHQEQEEQEFGNPCRSSSNTREPKSAATSAIMRKIKAQRSILSPPSESNRTSQWLCAFFS